MIRLNYYITRKEHQDAMKSFFREINVEDFFKIVEISASKCELEINGDTVEFTINETYKNGNFRISSCININQTLNIEYKVLVDKCKIIFHLRGDYIKKTIDLCIMLFKALELEDTVLKEITKFLIEFYQDEKGFEELKRQQNSLIDRVELLYSTIQKKYNMCD